MSDDEIIAALAGGARIYCNDEGFDGYSYELRQPGTSLDGSTVSRLVREGWIAGPNAYRLTDAGRAAFIRSTDEMGDGKLQPPTTADSVRDAMDGTRKG